MRVAHRLIAIAQVTLLAVLTGAAPASGDVLRIGDPAPPLDITHWLKGEAVKSFRPGTVYVLEFWATWCGPCVANMEHLSEGHDRYLRDEVTVIGLSDERLSKVVSFLASRYGQQDTLQNDRIRYSLATDPDRSVYRAYMDAAGLRGIPTVFVIGKDARVEWVGHPQKMDAVLASVVDDTWQRSAHRSALQGALDRKRLLNETRDRFISAMDEKRWEDAIEQLDRTIAGDRGELSVPIRYSILLSCLKDDDRASAYARRVRDEVWDENPWLLYQLAWVTIGNDRFPVEPGRRDLDFALETIVRAAELEPENELHFMLLATIRIERDEPVEAVAAQRRAIKLFEAVRPRIAEHEHSAYEADLREMGETLAIYARQAGVER